ncbi:hypothetical protein HYH03_008177 [Edaphochlamys debaryana]|uniref:BAP29/BAP31 transmembrane domain-containing protein n=1 Tax=Edaphochlamys debaryana TaxID=47281 RepID=A0A836BZQ9_9CHLO|nr:hypothetical protein HYH03_008177 [Edaphochlamys debaryana]|eukprot:KAG2493663.1 hypothetical protein HYH03_008177 [Edaphochlamys debaryana]
MLPPPLILTILLLLPSPGVVKKGLLTFTRSFLFFQLFGGVRLVHVAILVTGAAFAASSMHTYHLTQAPMPDTLTPNQRTAVLARRWREERNFWIATLTFLLWGLLYRFYALMLEHVELKDRVRKLQAAAGLAATAATGGSGAAAAATGKAGAVAPPPAGKGAVEPSAPPLEAEPKKAR